MPRTFQTVRRRTGGKSCHLPACYQRNLLQGPPPPSKKPSKKRCSFRKRATKKHVAASVKASSSFALFAKLPEELRRKVWEMAAKDGRVVAVRSISGKGLRAPIPPILHACSTSRAIGLKHYTLCFAALAPSDPEETLPDLEEAVPERVETLLPARVYFNFDCDTFYVGKGWNYGAEGPWSCISQLSSLIMKSDLQRVQYAGFALNSKTCSPRSAFDHIPLFRYWTGLKTLYLALEQPGLDLEGGRAFREVRPEEESAFWRAYRESEAVVRLWDGWNQADAMDEIRNHTIWKYFGHTSPPDGFGPSLVTAMTMKM